MKSSKLTILKELGIQTVTTNNGTEVQNINGNPMKGAYVEVQCECGTIFKALKTRVVTNRLKSCGCMYPYENKTQRRASTAYTNLIRRCLGKSANYNKEAEENYEDVNICNEWLPENNGRANFISWWESQPNAEDSEVSIDKDLGSRETGIKLYSPETCILAKKTLQMQATRLIKKNNKTGYRGVQVRSDKKLTNGKKFRAELRVNFKRYNLGSYHTIENVAFAVNYFIINSVAHQPLNVINTTKVDTDLVISNTLLQKAILECKQLNE